MWKALLAAAMIILTPVSQIAAAGIHGVNLKNPKVAHIVGDIDYRLQSSFEVEMFLTSAMPGDRLIIIDSPGGYVEVGLRMIQQIEREKARGVRVVCVVVGNASSMAFNLLTHCNVRIAAANTQMVVHKIAVAYLPGNERMTARNLRALAKALDVADDQFRRDNAKAMHLTLQQYDEYADRETDWSPQELKERGYLDDVINEGSK